jgi:hypothetical protein
MEMEFFEDLFLDLFLVSIPLAGSSTAFLESAFPPRFLARCGIGTVPNVREDAFW